MKLGMTVVENGKIENWMFDFKWNVQFKAADKILAAFIYKTSVDWNGRGRWESYFSDKSPDKVIEVYRNTTLIGLEHAIFVVDNKPVLVRI